MEILKAKTGDLFSKCEKYSSPVFSRFLDGGELAYIHANVKYSYGFNVMEYGGRKDAERRMIGVFPEWEEPSEGAFPIKCIRFSPGRGGRELSHRDYLGTLMSLGIERDKTGDILIINGCGHVILCEDIADFVLMNISKIANTGVKGELVPLEATADYEPAYRAVGIVVPSMRLDAVAAALTGKSRSASAELIRAGKVSVNHVLAENVSREVKPGDLISVRGFGRARIDGISGATRKQRLHINIKKYI